MTRSPLITALAVAVLLTGCSANGTQAEVTLPPAGAGFDYQLSAPYAVPAGVTVVARDSTAEPAEAGYDICYLNGFQTQPDATEEWLAAHAALLLHDEAGSRIADPAWPGEYLLDTSSALQRSAIVATFGSAIARCAEAGYEAVEIDNLDSYTRSGDRLTIDDNIALAVAYADLAHRRGLAIGQKNGSTDSARFRDEVGFDFAVTENCAQFAECSAYTDVYGELVFDIEYDPAFLAAACEAVGSAVLRDIGLLTPDDPAYVYQTC